MSWNSRLIKPIVPAKGRPIATLSDARAYILALPESEQTKEFTQDVVNALMMAAEGRGPILTIQAGMATLVNGPVPMSETPRPKKRWFNRPARS